MRRPLLSLLLLTVSALTAMAAPPRPLQQAHSHNDYEQKRPLFEALDHGFCSVEADIHLVDGQLLVAHDRVRVRPERSLESMYLAPLRTRCQARGGSVHGTTNGFTLLIDIKADAEGTYRVLDPLLRRYASILTRFTPTNTTHGAVTVILSGARPTATVAAQAERFCAIDGRPEDLERTPSPPPHLIPMISDSWGNHFKPSSASPLPAADQARLAALSTRVHAQGRRLRFWGAPDRPWLWNELRTAGVDVINTDRIPHLAAFLRGDPAPAAPSAPTSEE